VWQAQWYTYHANEWIQNPLSFVGQCQHETLEQFHRTLARMDSFFHVVRFHVGDFPNVTGVLAQRVATKLALLRPLEILFLRVFLRHPDGIQIEGVLAAL